MAMPNLPKKATSLEQAVTIYADTKKYEATCAHFWIEKAPRCPTLFRVTLKVRRRRNYHQLYDQKGATVILKGWEHPELHWLTRSLEDAPRTDLRPGVICDA
jgi:hypothetical protein